APVRILRKQTTSPNFPIQVASTRPAIIPASRHLLVRGDVNLCQHRTNAGVAVIPKIAVVVPALVEQRKIRRWMRRLAKFAVMVVDENGRLWLAIRKFEYRKIQHIPMRPLPWTAQIRN